MGYTPDDYTPGQWKAAWDRGMIGQNTGMPLFPPSTQFNSRGEPYNPARVGRGGVVLPAQPFPRDSDQPTVTPAAYKPGDTPQPPAKPENINEPTPPSPAVTPGQYSPSPWHQPQIAAIPRLPRERLQPLQPPPTPDTLTPPPSKQGDRYWNPVGQQQPFAEQINRYAHEYGVPPTLLSNLLRAESNFNPNATGPMTKYGQAGGIAQFIPQTAQKYHINPYDPDQGIRGAANYLRDLYTQKGNWSDAVAAYNGAKSINVSQYRGSPEGRALIAYAAALDGGLVKAGPLVPPPQNYRPVSYTPRGGYPSMTPDRPPSMWGRDHPSMFEGPGAVPHEREIPGILQGLAPFLMIGLALFSKGAALPMLSAFAGYQNAKNKRHEADAKELKTYYQDKLKETKARMSLEQGDAAAAMAMPPGPERDEALQRIALEYGDSQLQAIVAQGGDPRALFQARDKAYQDISKTDLAERRFELSQQEFLALEEQRNAQNERANATSERERKAADDKEKAAAQKAADAKKAREKLEHDFPGSTSGGGADEGEGGGGGGGEGEGGGPRSDTGGGEGGDGGGAPAASPASSSTPAPTPEGGGEGGDGGGAAPAPSPRWGPGGPPPGYNPKNDPLAPEQPSAAPSSAPAPAPRPRAQPISQPGGEDQVIPAPGAPRLIPAADITEEPSPTPAIPRVPPEPSQAAIEDAENNTFKLGRSLLHGAEPPQGMRPGVNQAAEIINNELATKLTGLVNSGLTGDALISAIRKIDNQTANQVDAIMNNRMQLPSAQSLGSSRLQAYAQRLALLAQAGAPPNPATGDPGWDPGQWQRIQDFKDDNKRVQFTLSRANTMSEAYSLVMQDLKNLQEQGIPPDAISRALAKFNTDKVMGDPTYTSLAADLQRFTQEEQFLVAGAASVTETERGIQSVFTPVIPGSPEQIRGYMKNGLKTAAARVNGYEHQWKMMHAPGEMYGSNPDARGVMGAVPYLNIKTGRYDNLPKGMTLPPDLESAQPTLVPKDWHPDTDYK